MKKTKEQKGITLIALIITIVVLLILAAVAISSITNDGILSYSTNAAKNYNQAVINEQETIGKYENFLNNYRSDSVEGEDASTIISFTIDGTSYQAQEGMTWEEWIGSDYNTDGYSNRMGGTWVYPAEGTNIVKTSGGYSIYTFDTIIENTAYILGSSGGEGEPT